VFSLQEEEFPVQIDLDENAQFHFAVKDKDFIGCDRLCYLSIPVKHVMRTGSLDDWLPLTKKVCCLCFEEQACIGHDVQHASLPWQSSELARSPSLLPNSFISSRTLDTGGCM
jgi:hypothetical protein